MSFCDSIFFLEKQKRRKTIDRDLLVADHDVVLVFMWVESNSGC